MTKYKAIKVNGIKCDEHRYIMEQHLGRKLSRNELVHHVNEDKRDNRIDNLRVMSLAEHSRMHQLGRKASPETLKNMSRAQIGNPYGPPRKLSDEQVRYIRDNYIPRDDEFGARPLSRKFGIDHSTISRIASGSAYQSVK